jgi:precorrin-2 dehydrogenase / sirohydrochlorin ferrochelatase
LKSELEAVATMRYYPIHLDIRNRPCLVVGGGAVATRKVKTLLDCGAEVTVVSPVATKRLHAWAGSGAIRLKERGYQSRDLAGILLVIGATDDEILNRRISSDAERLNILCNIVDRPEVCNFILPSIVQRDDLVMTISTSGKSPALAKKLRQTLERQFGAEYADFLRLMGAIRTKLLSTSHAPESHKFLFEQLINSNLIEMIRDHQWGAIDALLMDILGEGYLYKELMR